MVAERTLILSVGNERFDSSSTYSVDEIKDLSGIIIRLRQHSDPLSAFLWQSLSNPKQLRLTEYQPSAPNSNKSRNIIINVLNKTIGGPCIYEQERFRDISLRPETADLIKQSPMGANLARLNRMLLEDAYSQVLSVNRFDSRPFEERNLSVKAVTKNEALKSFTTARALIIAEREGDIAKIKAHFQFLLPAAEQHGLAIIIFVSPKDQDRVTLIKSESVNEKCAGNTVEIYSREKIKEAAEYIARVYVGPFQRSIPKIDPIKLKDPEMKVLLRRAFFDCNRIHLEPLFGGKASDGVYRVHAWCDGANIGPRPLPFFIKFGKPSDIENERQIYRIYAELYIPFNLRPNLDQHRCVRGSKYSALVGNFVEDATPLREALRQGVGDGVLFALFETSLKAFRVQAFAISNSKQKAGLDAFVKNRARCEAIKQTKDGAKILSLAALKSEPEDLERRLCDAAKEIHHWWGPIHGDLHAGNVMVRRGDSILIDFGSVTDGPLTADSATLEVSLVFGTDKDDHPEKLDEWKAFVDSAYDCIPRIRPPNPTSEPTEFDWLRQAVRELRHILFGCDCDDYEAEVVLAAYLLRFARLPIEIFDDPKLNDLAFKRHAYALVVAERIVNEIQTLVCVNV
jgi:hypothetical protein